MTSRWPPRIAAFLLWALAAGTLVYWVLRVVGMSETPVAAATVTELSPSVSVADLAKALGPPTAAAVAPQAITIAPAAPDPSARMRLLGVVADRNSGGVALISIDGQAAKPYRVGSQIEDGYRLTKVAKRSATLSPAQSAGAAITLELPDIATLDAAAPQRGIAGPSLGRRFEAMPAPPSFVPPAAEVTEPRARD